MLCLNNVSLHSKKRRDEKREGKLREKKVMEKNTVFKWKAVMSKPTSLGHTEFSGSCLLNVPACLRES